MEKIQKKTKREKREERESEIKLQNIIGKVNRSNHQFHVQTESTGGTREDFPLIGRGKDSDVARRVERRQIRGKEEVMIGGRGLGVKELASEMIAAGRDLVFPAAAAAAAVVVVAVFIFEEQGGRRREERAVVVEEKGIRGGDIIVSSGGGALVVL